MSAAHGPHCTNSRFPCLSCKLKGWRSGSSSLGVAIPWNWRGPSVGELERRQVQEAADAGIPIERAAQ